MTTETTRRAAEPREFSGHAARATRGRRAAPRFIGWITDSWRPVISKVGGGLLGAAVLAAIGFRARTPSASPDAEGVALHSSLFAPSSPETLASAMAFPSEADAAVPTPSAAPAPAATAPAASEATSGGSPAILPDGRIVLNLASEEDLRRLPGIGPTRARSILELRGRLAKFRALEDLLRVRGIGRKTIQRMRPAVVVDRPP